VIPGTVSATKGIITRNPGYFNAMTMHGLSNEERAMKIFKARETEKFEGILNEKLKNYGRQLILS
jgi:hypothetical protein